ncbi:Putative metabolite transport protein YwtG [Galdieria sulphuraria]|nr:Putative metabolite transport protein YwtG [Galdieria sulphuraria]
MTFVLMFAYQAVPVISSVCSWWKCCWNGRCSCLTIASTLLGALFGSLLSIVLNRYFGRKGAMFFGGLDVIAAGLLEALCNSWTVLLLGRLTLGLCLGLMTSTIPMFLAESSSKDTRGTLTTVYELAYAIGYFTGLVVDVIFVHVDSGWRFMLGSIVVPASCMTVGLFFTEESPRWLLARGQEKAAWDSLVKLRRSDQTALEDYASICEFMRKERETTKSSSGFLRIVFEKSSVRRLIMLGIALQIAQQFCGVNAVMYYFDYVLQLTDRVGRRTLLLLSMPFLSLTLWVCGLSFLGGNELREALNISGTILFRFFFGLGLGPVVWVLVAEIYPSNIRSQCLTLNSFASYLFNFIVSFTWPAMLKSMHAQGAFGFFAGFTLLSTLFVYLFVPETKGLEMDSIQDLFQYSMNGEQTMSNTAANSFKGKSSDVSFDCVVVETVINVSLYYNEQSIEKYSALLNSSSRLGKLAGYSEVERVHCVISDISQLEQELRNMHKVLDNVRSLLLAVAEGSNIAKSNETFVHYLHERNGMMNCILSCLKKILLFENRTMEVKSSLRLKEQESIADIKGRTDRVLEVDIAGVFFSAVFSGVLLVPAYFAFNMLIPIEHLKNGSTYFFIAVVIACFVVIFIMTILYAKWLQKNRKMRVLFAKSLSLDKNEDRLPSL